MYTTSHFLAVSLDADPFADLLVALQEFCRHHHIEASLELQNPLSLHITVYYFPQELTNAEMFSIEQFLHNSRGLPHVEELFIRNFDYFKRDGIDHICYLVPTPTDDLSKTNQYFRSTLPNQVSNNTYAYTPHMTLFTIKDYAVFHQHQKAVEEIIKTHLHKIATINACREINLYAVNSRYSPQIQLVKSV